MDLYNLIQNAELDLPFTSGRGLGAVLLAFVLCTAIFKSAGLQGWARALSNFIKVFKR
ncbi:MAG: hypothetical protein ACI9PY_000605 [Ascidiaceihabitans sp.]|jgi:hypothetical protein